MTVARLCGRPGCSEPGAAAYGMVPEELLFWVEPLVGSEADAGVLCRRHADAMTVPRGWTLDDRREPQPRLFRPKVEPATDASGSIERPRRARGAPRRQPSEQLVLPSEDPADPAALSDADLEVADLPLTPAPWRPDFDTDDDLGGLLSVESPLLARAFRGAGRERA